MKQRKKITKVSVGSLLVIAIFSQALWANFDVMVEDEDEYTVYGQAKNRSFEQTVEGSEPITNEDKAFLSQIDKKRTIYRGYLRGLVGKPTYKLKKFQDASTADIGNIPEADISKNDKLLTLLLAWGYNWQNWAAEMELFFSRSFKWSSDPLFPSVVFAGDTKLRENALFFNGRYNFPFILQDQLFVFLMGGLGFGHSSTTLDTYTVTGMAPATTIQSGDSKSTSSTSLAYQLGFGGSFQVAPKLLLELSYRYMHFGKAKYGPVEDVSLPMGQNVAFTARELTSSSFFVGAVYQIG